MRICYALALILCSAMASAEETFYLLTTESLCVLEGGERYVKPSCAHVSNALPPLLVSMRDMDWYAWYVGKEAPQGLLALELTDDAVILMERQDDGMPIVTLIAKEANTFYRQHFTVNSVRSEYGSVHGPLEINGEIMRYGLDQ